MLSGFLVTRIILEHRGATNLLRTFYLRRIFRIVPLLYAVVALAYIGLEVIPRHPGPVKMPYIFYLVFANDIAGYVTGDLGKIAVLWSLAIEEKFYLLAPFIVRLGDMRMKVALVVALMAASGLRQGYLFLSLDGVPPLSLYIFRWEALCIGVLIALAEKPIAARPRQMSRLFGAGFVISFSAAAVLHANAPGLAAASLEMLAIACIYGSAVGLAITLSGTRSTRLLRNRSLRELGGISYGIYVLHQLVRIVIDFAFKFLAPESELVESLVVPLVALAATVALASLSWRWFEAPLVRYAQRRFTYGTPERANGGDQ